MLPNSIPREGSRLESELTFFLTKTRLKRLEHWLEAQLLATVPKISIVIRKAYGVGWLCMLSPYQGADFVVSWPMASISFVDPEIGVELVQGRRIEQSPDPVSERKRLIREWGTDSTPWRAAELHHLDDVIDPRDTRKWIAQTLEIIRGKRGNTISKHKMQNWPTGF